MSDFDIGTVADRVIFTPAERAVLLEQGESLKVATDAYIASLKEGTARKVMEAYISVIQINGYVEGIFQAKVMQIIHADHTQGREH